VGGPSHGTRYFGGSPAGPEWSEDTPFGGPVVAFTVRSAVGQNTLEWLNPASGPYVSTTVRFKEATDPTACTFPSGGSDGALLERRVGTPGARDSIVHSGLTNAANTYCYGVFIEKDDGQFSAGRFVRSRPLSAAGPVHWTFGTGATAVVPTGINVLAYVVSNDRLLHAMTVGTSGGFWPAGWTPFRMNEPSQGRPTVSGVSLGGASRVAFVGSQDGHVHAVNADTGAVIWSSPLLGVPGDAIVQAAPSGIFNGVAGGTFDLVLVGTRSSAIANTFVAMNLADGSVAWRFTNALDQGGDGGAIGIVSGQAAVDVPNRRVYFASRARAGGTANTVWCLDFTGSTVTRRWARDVGNVDGSPVHRDGRVYVGTNEGLVHALDADDGTPLWSHSPVPLDGPVKGFVWPVRASSRLYFATTNRVWAIDDDGDRATSRWSLAIPSPSTTLFSGTHVYVGAGDGRLYQIDPSGAATSVALAGGPSQVGSPSMDFQNGLIYVGSDTGRIYAVAAPLP
jgi:outer membrane protein assembly factor BamB